MGLSLNVLQAEALTALFLDYLFKKFYIVNSLGRYSVSLWGK